ncbi:hypothetical protein FQN55_007430 [Onygenales sp. PD_40]|nr:hypothetical protein FQN55_007430 [Onygenales sp. PD_40]
MDHSMHAAGMDHGHGDMDMGGDQCSMNMLFTMSSKNLCIIFRQWRVTGPFSLFLSLVAIVLLTAGYEGVRELGRRYEARYAQVVKDGGVIGGGYSDEDTESPAATNDNDNLLPHPNHNHNNVQTSSRPPFFIAAAASSSYNRRRKGKLVLGALYAIQVFYSFMIMLLFMTYNGWVMLAVAVGAFVGYILFGSSATKAVSCH